MSDGLKTGLIWSKSPSVRGQIVRRVCKVLEKTYRHSRLGNPEDPLDDLIFIIISNKTTPTQAQNTYKHVKKQFATWDDALNSAPVLHSLLRPAGLATVKSEQIMAALQKIQHDFGSCDFSGLIEQPENEVQKYLVSLPGVSEKVAKCVMMYTMGKHVLPVDSHVHRIAKRLGWTSKKRADQCHNELERLISPKRRYAFHVDCILHGRSICRPNSPKCNLCCINRYCAHDKSGRLDGKTRKTYRN